MHENESAGNSSVNERNLSEYPQDARYYRSDNRVLHLTIESNIDINRFTYFRIMKVKVRLEVLIFPLKNH